MGKAHTKIIIALAVVAAVVAILVAKQREERTIGRFEGKNLFESADIDGVAEIVILGGDEPVHLKKISDAEWGVASRENYPADRAQLRRLVISLFELEAVDRLTSNPEKYDQLGVGENPETGQVRLLDGDGKPLADLLLGKRRETKGGQGLGGKGQFVRAGGDPAVYMSNATLFLEKTPTRWLRRELLSLPADELTGLRVEHGDEGASFAASRPEPDAPFELETPVPEGKKLKPGALDSLSRAVANLVLTDVMPANSEDATAIEFGAAYRAATKTGWIYRIEAGEREGKYYVRLSAEANPEATIKTVAGEEDAAEVPVEESVAAQEEVKSFNERHGPWIYQIQKFAHDNIAKKLTDLLEEGGG